MDFTYFVAGFIIAVVVGVIAGTIFLLAKGESFWRLMVISVPVAVIADFGLLLDFSRVEAFTIVSLLPDFGFFSLYGMVGCALGALPLIAARGVYRRVLKAGAD